MSKKSPNPTPSIDDMVKVYLENVSEDIEITHINLNDSTVSGFKHKRLPIMGIQYHSEASPGPYDNEYIFDEFISLINLK